MAVSRYSELLDYKNGQDIKNPDLIHSLHNLMDYLEVKELEILEWSDVAIAIPLTVNVNLPSLGTYEGVDIRSKEPILIVLYPDFYPMTGPRVYPDRLDFPRKMLGHLYVPVDGKPPGFCLVREDIDEWYAGKQLKDVVIRAANWLQDAATGELVINNGQFEPLRLEGFTGKMSYRYDDLAGVIAQKKSVVEGLGYAMALFEHVSKDDGHHFRFIESMHDTPSIRSALQKMEKEEKKDVEDASRKDYSFGFILWAKNDTAYRHYDIDLPKNWAEFTVYFNQYGLDVESFSKGFGAIANGAPAGQAPVVVAIKRPAPMIGFTSDLELLNFHVELNAERISEEGIKGDAEVVFKKHVQTLDEAKAKEISGFVAKLEGHSLFAGLGALGMRIALHLAKSGDMKFTYADKDKLEQHNFIRLPLSARHGGRKKITALLHELLLLYTDGDFIIEGAKVLDNASRSDLESKEYEWIMDFTASPLFLSELVRAKVPGHPRVVRGIISDFGDLGILLEEGKGRNPRVDDLQMSLYATAGNHPGISAWLQREAKASVHSTNIATGLGCSSETTVLANDIIDVHAGLFSGAIKSATHEDQAAEGKIYLNQIIYQPFFQSKSELITVKPFDVVTCINDDNWEVRYAAGILDKMRAKMKKAYPKETGGVFLGRANHKTRVLHVVDLIDAPKDSKSSKVCFFRGVKGLKATIDDAVLKSGNQVGYIGEWHSHPKGPEGMSTVDAVTVARFKSEYEGYTTPLPVFLTIITPNSILPFIY